PQALAGGGSGHAGRGGGPAVAPGHARPPVPAAYGDRGPLPVLRDDARRHRARARSGERRLWIQPGRVPRRGDGGRAARGVALATGPDPDVGGVRVLRRAVDVPAIQVRDGETALVTQPVPPPGGTPAGPSGPRADFWYRLGGFLIDWAILYVISLLIGLVFRGNLASQILISLAAGIAYSGYFIGSSSRPTPGQRPPNIPARHPPAGGRP